MNRPLTKNSESHPEIRKSRSPSRGSGQDGLDRARIRTPILRIQSVNQQNSTMKLSAEFNYEITCLYTDTSKMVDYGQRCNKKSKFIVLWAIGRFYLFI